MKAPRSGGTPLWIATDLTQPDAIAVDAANVYWIDPSDWTILTAPK
jgi:hypothetical protein